MDHAKTLYRDHNGIMLIAPLARAAMARPRLLRLHGAALDGVPAARRDAFLTSRAMILRGMRLFGMPVSAVNGDGDWPAGLTGAVGDARGQVAVWLRRGTGDSLGLDLGEIRRDPLSKIDLGMLADLPGLARMSPDERRTAAISARRALAGALSRRAGENVDPTGLRLMHSARPGITLGLGDGVPRGIAASTTFRVSLRVMRGVVLTHVAVEPTARPRHC